MRVSAAKRPAALSPASRARNLNINTILGLAPQALCLHLIRRLQALLTDEPARAGGRIEPGAKAPGSEARNRLSARSARQRCRPLRGLGILISKRSWGLRPRL